jgi:nitroreductase
MDVKDAIEKRRALRSLEPFPVTMDLVEDLAGAAHLAPSCMNNQSWRFVFVYEEEQLAAFKGTLSRGNAWALDSPLIAAVFSKEEADCALKGDRDYFLFDTGMAVGFMMLRATELGLIAHPIAGYDPDMVKEVLGIPPEFVVITLVIFGKLAPGLSPRLAEWQQARETGGRERRPLDSVLHHNSYDPAKEPEKDRGPL